MLKTCYWVIAQFESLNFIASYLVSNNNHEVMIMPYRSCEGIAVARTCCYDKLSNYDMLHPLLSCFVQRSLPVVFLTCSKESPSWLY